MSRKKQKRPNSGLLWWQSPKTKQPPKPKQPCSRAAFRAMVELSLRQAEFALSNAKMSGWRQDCLSVAAQALSGALKNIDEEDAAS